MLLPLCWYADLEAPATAEVDEASFGVGVEKLHAKLIPHVESFNPLNDAALDRRIEDAYPRSLRRCAGVLSRSGSIGKFCGGV